VIASGNFAGHPTSSSGRGISICPPRSLTISAYLSLNFKDIETVFLMPKKNFYFSISWKMNYF